MSAEKTKLSPYFITNVIIITCIMIFMPLSRGGVNMWQQTIMALGVQLGLIILLIENKLTGEPRFNKTELFVPIIILFVWLLLSACFSKVKAEAFTAIYEIMMYIGFYYIVIHSIRSRKARLSLVYLITFIAILLSIIGFLQLADIRFPWWQYWEKNNFICMTATYGNHNHLAGYLEMSIPLVIMLFLVKRNLMAKIFLASSLLLIISAHLLTLSRGGWGALTVSSLFLAVVLFTIRGFKKNKSFLAISIAVSLSAIIGLLGTNIVERAMTLTEEETFDSYNGRNIVWEGTLELIKDNILFGTGPGTYGTIFTQYQPPGVNTRFYYAHNDYLQYVAELGMPALVFILWFLYRIFSIGKKKLKSRSRQTWGINLGALTGIVAILIHSFIDFNLHIPANALLFITLVAVIMVEIKPSTLKEN